MSSLKQTSTSSCGGKCFKSFPPLVFHVRSSHDLMLREDPAFTCLETKWKFITFCLLLEEEKCVSLSSGLGILITLLHLGSNSIVSLSPTNTRSSFSFKFSCLIPGLLVFSLTLLVFLPLTFPSFFLGLRDVFYSWLILIRSHSSCDTRRERERERDSMKVRGKDTPKHSWVIFSSFSVVKSMKKVFGTFCHFQSQGMFVFLSLVSHHTCYAVRPFKMNHVFLYFQGNFGGQRKELVKSMSLWYLFFCLYRFFHYFSGKE